MIYDGDDVPPSDEGPAELDADGTAHRDNQPGIACPTRNHHDHRALRHSFQSSARITTESTTPTVTIFFPSYHHHYRVSHHTCAV